MNDDRPVLVTGATGFIGLEVCRQLAARNVPTRAVIRRRHRAALLAQLDVELVAANLTSPSTIDRAVDGCRAVIHLGGRATFEPYGRLAPTIVDGTGHVAVAAARSGTDRIVFGSSLFVHRDEDGPIVDTCTVANPTLDYGRAKLEAENILASGPVPALSIRLPHVYGWNDLLFGILRSGYLPFPADLDVRFPHQHVSDAAATLIAAVEHPATGAHPVADEMTVSWRHFLDVVKTYLPSATIIPLPSRPVELLLRAFDRLPIRHPTMLGGDTIAGWSLNLEVAPGSMEALGVTPVYPTVDIGIPAVLDSALPYRWRHPVFDHTSP